MPLIVMYIGYIIISSAFYIILIYTYTFIIIYICLKWDEGKFNFLLHQKK